MEKRPGFISLKLGLVILENLTKAGYTLKLWDIFGLISAHCYLKSTNSFDALFWRTIESCLLPPCLLLAWASTHEHTQSGRLLLNFLGKVLLKYISCLCLAAVDRRDGWVMGLWGDNIRHRLWIILPTVMKTIVSVKPRPLFGFKHLAHWLSLTFTNSEDVTQPSSLLTGLGPGS